LKKKIDLDSGKNSSKKFAFFEKIIYNNFYGIQELRCSISKYLKGERNGKKEGIKKRTI
jgi:hypothetical protein